MADESRYLHDVCPDEVRHGINERRPKISDYLNAGKLLKLRVINDELQFIAPGLILYGDK